MRIPLIYVAGPYAALTRWQEEQNARRAEEMGARLVALGAYPVIPHANTRPYFGDLQPREWWLKATLELMCRCTGAVFLRGFEDSAGALAEYKEAARILMPTFREGGSQGALETWVKKLGGEAA